MTTEQTLLTDERLQETDHDHVLFRGRGRGAEREQSESVRQATRIADQCDVTVIVSVGPYRSHDVSWEHIGTSEDTGRPVIRLDYYSVRPGYHHTDDIVRNLKEADL